jgi:exodeoxyribonuclease III
MLTIISWNVNGVRAAARNGMLDWLDKTQPDIFCIQETKAHPEQLGPAILEPKGYKTLWVSAQQKGYSGVAAFVKQEPLSVKTLGINAFDDEGRVQILEYKTFTLINAYFPNSRDGGRRLGYKLDFCSAMLKFCNKLRKTGKNLILCGDYNIAHKEIDLKNPKTNQNNAGFLPEERAWMDRFIGSGHVDTFRMFNQEPGHYTWWSYRFQARQKDIGWRVDYHCVNEGFRSRVKEAAILKDVMGSDHCPLLIRVK